MNTVDARRRFFAICSLLAASQVFADGGGDQGEWISKRLDEIASFAERVCKTAPVTGKSRELRLSTRANAELNELLRNLAAVGVEAAADYRSAEYEGVLQKDLAALLTKDAACKENVSSKLIERLMPTQVVK